jgi:hypothetical protein
MDKTISHNDYLRLLGLLKLAEDHCKALEDIERSAIALLGDEKGGHTGDTVWGGIKRTADELLKLLGIDVIEEQDEPYQH